MCLIRLILLSPRSLKVPSLTHFFFKSQHQNHSVGKGKAPRPMIFQSNVVRLPMWIHHACAVASLTNYTAAGGRFSPSQDERHHIKDAKKFLWQAQHTFISCIFPMIKVVKADHRAIFFSVFWETDTRICQTKPSSHRWPCYTPMWFVHSCISRISFPHRGCQSLTVALNYHFQGSALHARGPAFTHLWLKTEHGPWPVYLEFSATNLLYATLVGGSD